MTTIGPPFLPGGEQLDAHRAPSVWPGVVYPWMPWSPWSNTSMLPLPKDGRLCVGGQCWIIGRLRAADADQIVATLHRRSPPLAEASLTAAILYEKGFQEHARKVLAYYGGMYGMERVAAQIRAVYDPGPDSRPRVA